MNPERDFNNWENQESRYHPVEIQDLTFVANKKIEEIEGRIQKLKAKDVDTYDIEIELNIAKDKIKTAAFKMAETYLESIEKRVEKLEKGE